MSEHGVVTEADLDERLKRFRQNLDELQILAKESSQPIIQDQENPQVEDHPVKASNYDHPHKILFIGLEDLGRNKTERLQEVGELQMRKLFSSFDQDGGGTISEIEFVKACKNLRLNFDEEQLKLFFQEFDEDQNQSLDFTEFTALVKNLRSERD
jgi:hypothetical protein